MKIQILLLLSFIIIFLNSCCHTEAELKTAVQQNDYELVKEILEESCNRGLNGLLDWSVYNEIWK
ncbi:MAG: hypothetical protein JXR51_07150 [Bacteroidales bacterium]|nr:hypothetical protein [Bacteroidales bacterium]